MNHPAWTRAELERLIISMMDGAASTEQVARLDNILSDEEACRQYLNLASLYSCLHWSLHEDAVQVESPGASNPLSHPIAFGEYIDVAKGREFNRKADGAKTALRWKSYQMLAAALCGVALIAGLSYLAGRAVSTNPHLADAGVVETGGGDSAETQIAASNVVATIVRKIDCNWEDDRWNVQPSADLLAGQTIRILNGMMEIQFADGAMVVLEGPAHFTVESSMRGFLHNGMLTARVPERARGFTVDSPTSTSIDLGTEFGLSVAENGTSEVHVFEGEVVTTPTAANALENKNYHLLQNAALRITREGKPYPGIQASEEDFFRLLLTLDGDHSHRNLSVNKDLKVWYAADQLIRIDPQGKVSVWGDLLEGSNIVAEHAWQVDPTCRPTFVADAIHGKPALRFDGESTYLSTEPLTTGNNQTIIVVGRLASPQGPIQKVLGGQILNYNGPPTIVIQTSDNDNPDCLVGRLFKGKMDLNYGNVAQVRSDRMAIGDPFLLVYSYDFERNRARLFVNGRLSGETDAPIPAEITSPRFIGNHFNCDAFFSGDLAEMLIFDRALEDGEITEIERYLSEKYSLEMEGGVPFASSE